MGKIKYGKSEIQSLGVSEQTGKKSQAVKVPQNTKIMDLLHEHVFVTYHAGACIKLPGEREMESFRENNH